MKNRNLRRLTTDNTDLQLSMSETSTAPDKKITKKDANSNLDRRIV